MNPIRRDSSAGGNEEMRQRRSSWLEYFVKSYKVSFLIILGLAILGVQAVFTLPRESAPEIKVPFAAVVTIFPGSSTRDVEELITNKVEDELANLEGVKEITSSSSPGVSSVNIEFQAEEDISEAIDNLRRAVDNITGLPDEAKDPRVIELNFSDQPIIQIGISGIQDE